MKTCQLLRDRLDLRDKAISWRREEDVTPDRYPLASRSFSSLSGTAYAASPACRAIAATLVMSETAPESKPLDELDAEFLVGAPEIYIFSACLRIVQQVWALERTLESGETDKAAFIDQVGPRFTQLWGVAEATHRFDIVVPFTPDSGFSPFFWRWFNWWYDYREGLTPKEREHIHGLQQAYDRAVMDYRPAGHWLTHRQTAPFGFRMSPSPGVERSSRRPRSR